MFTTTDFQSQLTMQRDATGTPGIAMGIQYGDEQFIATDGITNANHPLPVTEKTLFQIGSITKTMTATVMMRLVEREEVNLDVPVRTYLPDFRLQDDAAAAAATVRHLFTHTGGWVGDYFEDTGSGDDGLARYVANMAALPQQAPLGTLWSYNNAAFSLAGRIIEVVTGEPFEAVMHQLLFEPLGMTMTFLMPSEVMTHRFVVGHTVVGDDEERTTTVATPWPLARSANPAGGVISTVPDMLRYARFHLDNGRNATGEQLLRPENIAAMQKIQAEAGTMASHVGISWLLNTVAGVRTISHGGATNGQIAQLTLVPERDFALVILTNANRGREVTRDLSAWALARYLEIESAQPATHALDAATRQEYTGYYSAQLTDIEVSLHGNGLQFQVIPKGGFPDRDSPAGPAPAPAPVQFIAADQVIVTTGASAGSRAEFIRNANGKLAWLRFGGRVHRRQ
ncbi:MAG: serine hydrolase domain-containing protein [Caldilineaceae bacterium]